MGADSLPDELQRVLQDHTDSVNAICNSFTDEVEATSVPPTIYHYTDDHGLRGILETGRLWFTDLFNLNDPSELNHGIKSALDVLESEADKGPPEAKKFNAQFRRALAGNVETSAHYFVCCFSTTGDDLGQWRAYADDGRGYAIGFNAEILEKAFASAPVPGPSVSTFPVSYDDKRLLKIHEQLVAKTIPAISAPHGQKLSEEVISQFMQSLSVRLAASCFGISLYFKHKAYSNEQEYRFLQVYPADRMVPDLNFRSRPYSLVRYRDFDWKSIAAESVKEIIIGPAGDQKVAIKFAYDCLREYLPADRITPIKASEIPYRSFRR